MSADGEQGAVEPFGYWVEQKGADPILLRKPAYIPSPSGLRTVTPLYVAPATDTPEVLSKALDQCQGIESGPNGQGGMRVVVHFKGCGDEYPLFSLLNAALAKHATDSTQISHRIGDFREARSVLIRIDGYFDEQEKKS